MSILINSDIQATVDSLAGSLPQSLLLTGDRGVGLLALAKHLAQKYTTQRIVQPELLTKASTLEQISIETVRDLYEQTRGKTKAESVVIIDDADLMTHSAQNAFLKLLEEPLGNLHFILTSHRPETLLPTIRSRTQTLFVPRISHQQTLDLLDTKSAIDATTRAQLLFVANGLPAELHRLTNDATHLKETIERVTAAKNIVQAGRYDQLVLVQKSATNRKAALALIETILSLLALQPTPQSMTKIEKLLKCYDAIAGGGSVRLQLTAAMV